MVNKQAGRVMYLLLSVILLATGMLGLPGAAAAATPVPLSSLAPGATVSFCGYTWIVLNPSTGYLLMQGFYGSNQPFDNQNDQNWENDNTFNPNNQYNIGYYLNAGFYGSLCNDYPAYAALIKDHSWNVGGVDFYGNGNESSSTVSAYIGLLSYNEWHNYATYYNPAGILANPSSIFWTITPCSDSTYAGNDWGVDTAGFTELLIDTDDIYVAATLPKLTPVAPAKPLPMIVTGVPPASGPLAGLMLVSVLGAGGTVTTVTPLLCADSIPVLPTALTVNVYVVFGVRLLMVVLVPVTPVATGVVPPFSYTL